MQAVSYPSVHRSGYAAIAALLAGFLYIIQAIMGQLWPQAEVFASRSDYVMEIVFVSALASTLMSLAALRSTHAGRLARTETVGFGMAALGTSGVLASAIATLIIGHNALGLIFVLGLLGTLIGQVIFGIALMRRRELPWWAGAALIFGLPLSITLDSYGGGALLGLSWLALGYHLHTTAKLPAAAASQRT